MNQEPTKEPGRTGGREPEKGRRPRSGINTMMTALIVILVLLLLINVFGDGSGLTNRPEEVSQVRFWERLYSGQVTKIEQEGDLRLTGEWLGSSSDANQRFVVDFPPGVLAANYAKIMQMAGAEFGEWPQSKFLEQLSGDRIVVQDAYVLNTAEAGSELRVLFDNPDAPGGASTKYWAIRGSNGGVADMNALQRAILAKLPNLQIRPISAANPNALKATQPNTFVTQLLVTVAPWLLIIGLFWFFLMRQMRSPGGGGGVLSFGRSRAQLITKEKSNVTFNDVAGVDEAKEEVREIIEFLKNPARFSRLGGRIPRGVLLVGPPGTGKTLLAKAIAGEANVPFFSISGSDFVEMFVGVGASRVRDLFRQAREHSPCLVFLDEIDAVGRKRGSGMGGGHDEREQTLNAILVEMDGFDTDEGIILVAATNRPDVLDPALLRPGRFDRQITVGLPDVKGREAILRVHTKKVKIAADVDMHHLARATPGFSGAELAAMVNEAALIATLKNKDSVELDDFEEARDKVRWGRQKKNRVMEEKDRRVTAYHEAGHALVAHFIPEVEPLHKVTIIPRGLSLGATMILPQRDRFNEKKKEILGYIAFAYGGRSAEELLCDDISTGAFDDIKRATDLARLMVCQWGMSEAVGPISYVDNTDSAFLGQEVQRATHHSESMAIEIDHEVRRILTECHERAAKILSDHKDALLRVAESLMRYETLTGAEVALLVAGKDIDEARRIDEERERLAVAARTKAAERPPQPRPESPPEFGVQPHPNPA